MSWTLLIGLVLSLGLAFFAAVSRRMELARMEAHVTERDEARRSGRNEAQLQHPVIDLSRCLGCGTCVAACPEDNVLELVHGQAVVVNGARCQGISACERECPVGAITVTIANLEQRTDVPVLDEGLEAVGSPGLFLAGEVTAHALIKTAIEHGTAVASEVARRVGPREAVNGHVLDTAILDLCIVGAGPAGLACSLEARRHGLNFVVLDQEQGPGGTVAKYPRRKLVMTEPVDLPLHGRLKRSSYSKEELMELWQSIAAEHRLPLRGGEVFEGLERDATGHYHVRTQTGTYVARHVCLALGRRGSPRKLGVPGEDLSKVAYSLIDAHSYQGRRILCVGGGDSAIETALGLAEQPGNDVTLSYRKDAFFRIRSRNEQRLKESVAAGRLEVLYGSEVLEIRGEEVDLSVRNGSGPARVTLPNDEVFVLAGGVPPFRMLEASGVSFDPKLRPAAAAIGEQGTGLVRALGAGLVLALAALAFAAWNADYYALPLAQRPTHDDHLFLRPGMGVGLFLGFASVAMVVVNLLYLVRRSAKPRFPVFHLGSLQSWMTSHVATGILAFLCALLHGAMAPRDTVGGHAMWSLAVLLVTGAVGRYFYAYVPRAANGRELELDEVKLQLGRLADQWSHGQRQFGDRVRDEIQGLIRARQWQSSFFSRAAALFGGQGDLRRALGRLASEGRAEGIPDAQLRETLTLARQAHRAALAAAHFEDLRAIAGTWRYFHRWVALLMVVLVVLHVAYAVSYGGILNGSTP